MPNKTTSLSIILPVYNERNRIVLGVEKAHQLKNMWGQNCEIIVVDDGSTDSCLELVRNDKIRILSMQHAGKGAAVKAGIMEASGDTIMYSDIDWSVPVEQAYEMVSLEEEIVIASREIQGASRMSEPSSRAILGKIFNRWVRWMLIADFTDTQCGCKVFSKRAAKSIFSKVKEQGWVFDVEVLVLAQLLGFKVTEHPVSWAFGSHSKIQLVSDGLQMAKGVLRIKKRLDTKSYAL